LKRNRSSLPDVDGNKEITHVTQFLLMSFLA
jgi:hypothetical protein